MDLRSGHGDPLLMACTPALLTTSNGNDKERTEHRVVGMGDTLFQESQKTHTRATEPLHMTAVLDGHGDALMDEVVKEWDSIITNLYDEVKMMDKSVHRDRNKHGDPLFEEVQLQKAKLDAAHLLDKIWFGDIWDEM